LTIGRFAPLEPGLFDYVVIDEASQCDIASALPLLARARRAIVVGDPAQLPAISNLSPAWEDELIKSLDLTDRGMGRFRQSRNSLFDLASTTEGAARHLLPDHFRCHSDIAAYVGGFYGGQLTVLTEDSSLRPPPGQRPGLYWDEVEGPVLAAAKGCHAPDEAEAILVAVEELLVRQHYRGSIGICTPFREQAKRITDLLTSRLPPELVTRARLIAQTANGFQGDARDVIFFSLCLGSDMPAGSLSFVREGGNLFNVAVSRARAVCRIVGNRKYAAGCGIPHVQRLVRSTSSPSREDAIAPRFESPWEQRLYEALQQRGIACVPQFPVAGRRLDLAWFQPGGPRIDIEVDGDRFHRDRSGLRKVDDVWRDHQLRGLGWKVMRFWVYELRENMNGCVERIVRATQA
jgi:very-short-patch-repair endonuclease